MKTIKYLLSIAGMAMILVASCKKDARETGQRIDASETSDGKVTFLYNGDSVTYKTITSPITGRKWLDRNLGASRAAQSYNDYLAYGDLFQWGRPADGHQLINWTSSTTGTPVNGITATRATKDKPNTSLFIVSPCDDTYNGDWRDDNNRNRWYIKPQGPCPRGWHVPTIDEWRAETGHTENGGTVGGFMNSAQAYSQLKLTVAGSHWGQRCDASTGILAHPGERGNYWSSTNGYNGEHYWGDELNFAGDYVQDYLDANDYGNSVRCIKNL